MNCFKPVCGLPSKIINYYNFPKKPRNVYVLLTVGICKMYHNKGVKCIHLLVSLWMYVLTKH